MVEKNPNPKRKPRLVVRLAFFLISHNIIVSILCCIAGFVTLFLLPVLAKNTYISENALMPGSANPTFSGQDVAEANKLAKDIISWNLDPVKAGIEIPQLIAQHMRGVGAEVYYQKFHSEDNQFHPLHFFSGAPSSVLAHDNSTCASVGVNTVGIVRAPRGDGKEAIVVVTPYNSGRMELRDALSLGLVYSIFSLLSRVTWLAKDIVWLAADSRYGEYTPVSAWLRDYHNPVFLGGLRSLGVDICPESNNQLQEGDSQVFRRAGTMAAALVFKFVDRQEVTEKETLSIYAEASNGQMPNLDLINVVNYLAVHKQGLHVKVNKAFSLLNLIWLKIIGEMLEWLSHIAASLNPQWKFAIPAADYAEGIATLASSIYYQALGIPTGSHGAFRDYQVDAVTLEISPKFSLSSEIGKATFLLKGGRLIEGVIRSINNLLEKFHQSFFLYFLTSPGKFVSVGVYMIAFALLVMPLPILAAALYSGNKWDDYKNKDNHVTQNSCSEEQGFAPESSRWLHAAKVVFIVHLWAAIVALLPYLIYQVPKRTSTSSMLTWIVLSTFILLFLYQILGSPYLHYASAAPSQSRPADWTILKSVMIAAASTGLGLMSIINFAAAQIGAIFLVPMCLIVNPVKHIYRKGALRAIVPIACISAILIIGFPPAALLMLKSMSKQFGEISIGDCWDWAESLWGWNSATYLYLTLVHLPCWVLCMHIVLHPL